MEQNYIGENIRIYRERAKITQQQLADKVGVTWEMISRYERNASSPMNKLDKLSTALGVSKSRLIEQHIPTSDGDIGFRLPLFTAIPKGFKFDNISTNYFYSSPEWIYLTYRDCFVIDTSILKTDISGLKLSGVFYISRVADYKRKDYILLCDNDLIITEYTGYNQKRIIGKVIAQEVRY